MAEKKTGGKALALLASISPDEIKADFEALKGQVAEIQAAADAKIADVQVQIDGLSRLYELKTGESLLPRVQPPAEKRGRKAKGEKPTAAVDTRPEAEKKKDAAGIVKLIKESGEAKAKDIAEKFPNVIEKVGDFVEKYDGTELKYGGHKWSIAK